MHRVLIASALVGCATNASDGDDALDPPAAGCAESFELRSLEGSPVTERYRLGNAAFCLRLDTTNAFNPPWFTAHTELHMAETSPFSLVLTRLDGVTDVLVTATARADSATTPLYFKLDEFPE